MRAVAQRVSAAAVVVGEEPVASINGGLLVLVGVAPQDTEADATAIANKLAALRVFQDGDGKMNRSVAEIGGAVLVVSQFTLLADVRKGRRPSFVGAADPDIAEPLVQMVADLVAQHGIAVATGSFGAHMEVHSVNDGPVTIVIETAAGLIC
jgi:D-tyrosyl-tRNA(Tyr) deacylase